MSKRPVAKSLREYGRGVVGWLIFSLPLLYTMEVWQAGMTFTSARLLAAVGGTFGLLLGYNRYAGLRRDANFAEVVIDSVEELGLGLVVALVTLWALGQLQGDTPATEVLGKVVVEGLTIAVGVSVGTAQLGGDDDRDTGEGSDGGDERPTFLGQTVIALCGAVLFGANVAPTDEIVRIAVESTPARLLALTALCLTVSTFILFYAAFAGADRFVVSEGRARVAVQAVMVSAVSFVASAALLWLFGRFDDQGGWACLAETVVLGAAASLGASAGRLLIQ
ncbi:MAG: DUF2391 family protein [Polyangiales bacterium]